MIRIIHFFNGSVVNNTLLRTEYNNIIFLYEYGLRSKSTISKKKK